jgi:ABC-type thiamine transport system substrate-binding protein
MCYPEYRDDKQLVVDLHYMAVEYDNEFLRKVANKLEELIEEKKREYNDWK